MNSRLPKDAEIREAIAGILATHPLEDLTYDRVYMLLEASFVCPLAAKAPQIKTQLEVLLFKFLVDYAANTSPNRNMPSPERPRDTSKQPIKKLLDHRLSDLKKKRSVELREAVVESVVAPSDSRYPIEALLFKGRGFWVSGGLFPQLIRVELSCPVCLERVVVEAVGAKRVRVECEKANTNSAGTSSEGGSAACVWDDVKSSGSEKELPDGDGLPVVCELKVPYLYTHRVLISIEEGYLEFVCLVGLSLFGIPLQFFQ